ncbi:MAG: tRNA lysidine(34) synthetase TilS [Arachnia sp.]
MARHELGPAAFEVARAVAAVMPSGEVIVGCSGGADSLALALGAQWAAPRCDAQVLAVVIDHGLQPASAQTARRVVEQLRSRGISAQVRRVHVDAASADGPEAAARDARLAELGGDGLPVLLGHSLDDQAETVLLGLLRGSGTRSLAGMAAARGPFLRPLLGVRRATLRDACHQWGLEVWDDPHNQDPRFARVRARRHLAGMAAELGRDLAPALARTATLARADADLLDELAWQTLPGPLGEEFQVLSLAGQPSAVRWRALLSWLSENGLPEVAMVHILAVDALVVDWRGQGPVAVPGGTVARSQGRLSLTRTWPAATGR